MLNLMKNPVLSDILLVVRAPSAFHLLEYISSLQIASVITPWSLSFASLDNSLAMDVSASPFH